MFSNLKEELEEVKRERNERDKFIATQKELLESTKKELEEVKEIRKQQEKKDSELRKIHEQMIITAFGTDQGSLMQRFDKIKELLSKIITIQKT